jgi:cytosine/adenosine deaminase-related metal-dependent hydrolase
MVTFNNASAWGLPNHGLIRTGYAANLVLFDKTCIKPKGWLPPSSMAELFCLLFSIR